jgi:hypothetical protein
MWYTAKKFPNHLGLIRRFVYSGKVLNHAAQPHREIIDTLLLCARGILKLPKQLLCRGCPHAVFANPQGLDHIPRFLRAVIAHHRRHHFWWHCTGKHIQRHHVFLQNTAAALHHRPKGFTFISNAQSD